MNAYYRAGDRYFDTTANAEYICTLAGDKTSSVWAQISGAGGSGSALQQFKIQSDGGDWWNCFTWDGTTLGTQNVYVIKPYKLRCFNGPTTETMTGVVYNYSYSQPGGAGTEYIRATTGSDGTNTTDYCRPAALLDDIIYALPCQQAVPIGVPTSVQSVTLTAGGTGYAANQILTLSGGTTSSPAQVKVLTVDGSGKILTYQLYAAGSYTANPTLINNGPSSGTGSGAFFNVTMWPVLLDVNLDARFWETR